MNFRVDWQRAGLPFAPAVPVFTSALAGRLYLVARDAHTGAGAACWVDGSGRGPGEVVQLPLTFVSDVLVDNRRNEVVVTGGTADAAEVVVLAINWRDDVQWRYRLTSPRAVSRWPRLFFERSGATALAWVGERTLSVATVDERGCHQTDELALETQLDQFAVSGAAEGLGFWMASTTPHRRKIDALRIVHGRATLHEAVEVTGAAFGLALDRVADRTALTWLDGEGATFHLHWLGENAPVEGDPHTVVSADAQTRLFAARMVWADDRSAVRWVTVTFDDDPKFRQLLAAYDVPSHQLGAATTVPDPGVTFDGGTWLGPRLVLLHGGEYPLLTAFQPSIASALR